MKKHLKQCAENYVGERSEEGIRPISLIDAEIITEVRDILKVKGESRIVEILDRWKDHDDGDVLDSLIDYGNTLDPETGEDNEQRGKGGSNYTIDYITIQEFTIKVSHLHSIKPIEKYDNGPKFGIIINESHWEANNELFYGSEDLRDQAVEDIKERLHNFSNVRFL